MSRLAAGLAFAAALLALSPARADDTDAIGRLFLTPEQRRFLDDRRGAGEAGASDMPADLLPARSAPRRRVVLNGVIRRGRDETQVWINGEPARLAAGGGVRVQGVPDRRNRVTVESAAAGSRARLKPGQSWDTVSGEISDCVQCATEPPPATPAAEPAAALPPSSPAESTGSAEPAVASTAATQAAADAP